jgi:hypothetical protein
LKNMAHCLIPKQKPLLVSAEYFLANGFDVRDIIFGKYGTLSHS